MNDDNPFRWPELDRTVLADGTLRRVYKIDLGPMDPAKAERFVEEMRRRFKERR